MLEDQDAELFYQLFFPLLDFVNKEYRICPEFETIDEDVDQSAQKVVADYLWAHTRIIDIYLSETELPDEYAQIIAGWKQRKIGTFLLERRRISIRPGMTGTRRSGGLPLKPRPDAVHIRKKQPRQGKLAGAVAFVV